MEADRGCLDRCRTWRVSVEPLVKVGACGVQSRKDRVSEQILGIRQNIQPKANSTDSPNSLLPSELLFEKVPVSRHQLYYEETNQKCRQKDIEPDDDTREWTIATETTAHKERMNYIPNSLQIQHISYIYEPTH